MQVNYTCVKSDSSRPLVSFFFSSAGGRVFTTTEAERLCRCPSCCAGGCWRADAFVLPTFYSDLFVDGDTVDSWAGGCCCMCLLCAAGWSWMGPERGWASSARRRLDETRDIIGSAAGLLPVIGIILQLNENCETHAEHIISPQASFPLQSVHNFPIRAT